MPPTTLSSRRHHLLRQLDNLRAVAGAGVIDPTTAPAGLLLALNRAAGVPDQAALEAELDRACCHILSALEGVTNALP